MDYEAGRGVRLRRVGSGGGGGGEEGKGVELICCIMSHLQK